MSQVPLVPRIDIADILVPDEVIASIDRQTAIQHMCVPINRSGVTLVFAMADPSDFFAIDTLRFLTGCNVEAVISSPADIMEAIERYYGAAPEGPPADTVSGDGIESGDVEDIASTKAEPPVDGPVIRLVNLILLDAIKNGAERVRFSATPDAFVVWYAGAGEEREAMGPPPRLAGPVLARLRVLAGMTEADTRGVIVFGLGQEGAATFHVEVTSRERDALEWALRLE